MSSDASQPPQPTSDVPGDAPEHCPGTQSEDAGKAAPCAGCPNQAVCESGAARAPDPWPARVRQKLAGVRHKIVVLSGKGGVGKSTTAVCLARGLARRDTTEVGLLDVDICGPSGPRMLGLEGEAVHASGSGWSPVYVDDNLAAMSVGFLLAGPDEAVIWRGAKKTTLIRQFLSDVAWGDRVDYLVVDTPPGTSDEHLAVVTYLKEAGVTGALLVTTPQEVSLQDVRKELTFCRKVGVPVLGLVETMAAFVCPTCERESTIFPATTGGAEAVCAAEGVEFLGRVPLDPRVGRACDLGLSVFDELPEDAPAVSAYARVCQRVRELCGEEEVKATDG